ncbi:unnamed protein product [Linum trigynum]|uniref:Uncharacterized protein n=1 Tax=Linum trigynum TaxID=586398 RepID=A0AAV2ENH5_9ROSI
MEKRKGGFMCLAGGLFKEHDPQIRGGITKEVIGLVSRRKFEGLDELVLDDGFFHEKVHFDSLSSWSMIPMKGELLEFDLATEENSGPMEMKLEEMDQHREINARRPSEELERDWKKRKHKKWEVKARFARTTWRSGSINLDGKVGLKGKGMIET